MLKVGPTAERLANSENAVPHAGVAELADAMDSKSIGATPWRFKSSHRYFFICTQMKRTARLGIYRVGLFLLHTQSARNSCVLPRLLLRLFSSQVLE